MNYILMGTVVTMFITNFSLMAGVYSPPSERQHKIYQDLYEELKIKLAKDRIYVQSIRGPTDGVSLDGIDIRAIMYNKPMYTYEEGMQLHQKTLITLLHIINQNRFLRPYLEMYPFKDYRISFVIEMVDASGKPNKYPLVSRIVGLDDIPKVICDTDSGIIILKKSEQS